MKKINHYIPFCRPYITARDISEVTRVLKSGWIGTGPKTQEFCGLFAKYVKARYAVGLNSCTAGLHLALVASGVSAGDEVITTPMTFAATAGVIEHVGAKLVFADINPCNLTIDACAIERVITKKTRAIIPVHLAGHPASLDEIGRLTARYNLTVIEDAAHAIESEYKGKKIGSISDFTAFSFYATKNITTGEGGMLTTNDRKMAEKVQILSLHGMSKDAWKRYIHRGITDNFEIIRPGFKYNMFDMQAALGINQLRKIEALYRRRKRLYQNYRFRLRDIDSLELLEESANIKHAYHLFIALLDLDKLKITRDGLRRLLDERNIGSGVHYISLHRHPYYRDKYKFRPDDFPVANRVSDCTISLPLYVGLKDSEQDYIIDTLCSILKRYRR